MQKTAESKVWIECVFFIECMSDNAWRPLKKREEKQKTRGGGGGGEGEKKRERKQNSNLLPNLSDLRPLPLRPRGHEVAELAQLNHEACVAFSPAGAGNEKWNDLYCGGQGIRSGMSYVKLDQYETWSKGP